MCLVCALHAGGVTLSIAIHQFFLICALWRLLLLSLVLFLCQQFPRVACVFCLCCRVRVCGEEEEDDDAEFCVPLYIWLFFLFNDVYLI